MNSDAQTRICAVIGNPVAHSRSPFIHSLFAEQTGLTLHYEKIEAPLAGFEDVVAGFFNDGGTGLNITVPFKERAYALVEDQIDDSARLAQAVNTLSLRDGKPHGSNTDGIGLINDFMRLQTTIAGKHVLLVGAGGAAKGLAFPLLDAGCASLRIVNRNPERAQSLCRHLQDTVPAVSHNVSAGGLAQAAGQWDIIINATSSSLHGAALLLPGVAYAPESLAYDLVYAAQPTPFMRTAAELGAGTVSDGLGMLVSQAAASFRIWHQRQPNVAPVLAALRQLLQTTH